MGEIPQQTQNFSKEEIKIPHVVQELKKVRQAGSNPGPCDH